MTTQQSKIRFISDRAGENVPLISNTKTDPVHAQPDVAPGSDAGFISKLALYKTAKEDRRIGDCHIILRQSAFERIMNHLCFDTTREHGGLLLGRVFHLLGMSAPLVVIEHIIPASHSEGTGTRLRFTIESWLEFQRETERLKSKGHDLQRVGWYHSHPDIGIFLSRWDLDVCSSFTLPTSIALVVDPINHLGGFFNKGVEGFRPDSPTGFWSYQDTEKKDLHVWKNLTPVHQGWHGSLHPELISLLSSSAEKYLVDKEAPAPDEVEPDQVAMSEAGKADEAATPTAGQMSPAVTPATVAELDPASNAQEGSLTAQEGLQIKLRYMKFASITVALLLLCGLAITLFLIRLQGQHIARLYQASQSQGELIDDLKNKLNVANKNVEELRKEQAQVAISFNAEQQNQTASSGRAAEPEKPQPRQVEKHDTPHPTNTQKAADDHLKTPRGQPNRLPVVSTPQPPDPGKPVNGGNKNTQMNHQEKPAQPANEPGSKPANANKNVIKNVEKKSGKPEGSNSN